MINLLVMHVCDARGMVSGWFTCIFSYPALSIASRQNPQHKRLITQLSQHSILDFIYFKLQALE